MSLPRSPGAQRGQSLVEFALALPVFLLLLFGLLDVGRLVYDYSTLANAARSGLRVAIVNQNSAGIQAKVTAEGVGLGLAAANVDYVGYKDTGDAKLGTNKPEDAANCSPIQPGCIAVIKVHYGWSAITPIIGGLVGPINLVNTSEMPVEQAFSNP